MAFTARRNQPCRLFELVLDDVRAYRHMKLMLEFSQRGIANPRMSEAGPNFVDGERQGTWHIFALVEEIADEYVTRMMPEPTKEEIIANRKFMGE